MRVCKLPATRCRRRQYEQSTVNRKRGGSASSGITQSAKTGDPVFFTVFGFDVLVAFAAAASGALVALAGAGVAGGVCGGRFWRGGSRRGASRRGGRAISTSTSDSSFSSSSVGIANSAVAIKISLPISTFSAPSASVRASPLTERSVTCSRKMSLLTTFSSPSNVVRIFPSFGKRFRCCT